MIKIANIGVVKPEVSVSNEGVTISTRTATDTRYLDLAKMEVSKISASCIHSPFRLLPDVEKVIFNPPATVVMWADGSKTVVKTHGEEFSEEHGLAMAIARKYFGGSRNAFQRACKTAATPSSEEEK